MRNDRENPSVRWLPVLALLVAALVCWRLAVVARPETPYSLPTAVDPLLSVLAFVLGMLLAASALVRR